MSRSQTSLPFLLSLLLLSLTVISAEGFSSTILPHSTKAATTSTSVTRTLRQPITTTTMSHLYVPSLMDPHDARNFRGGATTKSRSSTTTQLLFAADPTESKCPVSKSMAIFGSLWGSLGVVYILAKAIKRVLPIALEPFMASTSLVLSPLQWTGYAISCLFFAYAEGYKGFQLKFSPLVVKRSLSLVIGTKQGSVLNYLLAPLYSMGLIHATRKRMITSWAVTLGVAGIVGAVKRLPPVGRCIVDAGVVVGLTWGSISILANFFQAIRTGTPPSVDACLPDDNKKAS